MLILLKENFSLPGKSFVDLLMFDLHMDFHPILALLRAIICDTIQVSGAARA